MEIPENVQQITDCHALVLVNRIRELASDKIVNLSIGELTINTPEHIKEAAKLAINNNDTKYSDASGTPQLKLAIINKMNDLIGLKFNTDEIIVSVGAKHCLYNAMRVLLSPGEEVILAAPYWPSYIDVINLNSAKAVVIQTTIDSNFKITSEQLASKITDKTKLLILNSPSNPTGAFYNKEELKELEKVIVKNEKLVVICDEIYGNIIWGSSAANYSYFLSACHELRDRTIIVNGVSKCYAMTGWRIGYAIGPSKLIGLMAKVQSQVTSNPCTISQAAAVAALNGSNECINEIIDHVRVNCLLAQQYLDKIEKVRYTTCSAGLYIFPYVQNIINHSQFIKNDIELGEYLLTKHNVAILPGSFFGTPGYIRITLGSTSNEKYETGLQNILAGLQSLASY